MTRIRLACPAGCGGEWPIPADGAIWKDETGTGVAVIAGQCNRCESRVAIEPSLEAVAIIRQREISRREAVRKMRTVTGG